VKRIASAARIALAVALLAGAAATAEDPTGALRLTRLPGTEPAAAFSVAAPDGTSLALGDFKGKVVLLNFWATWCEPCLEEMPALERLARTYRARGLVVVALSVDREGASVVRPYLERHRLTFPVGLDPQQAVARLYRVWALPSTLILSRGESRSSPSTARETGTARPVTPSSKGSSSRVLTKAHPQLFCRARRPCQMIG
jgi:peroxiredoxin